LPRSSCLIAIADAGLIPYRYPARYIDLAGLNNPLSRQGPIRPLDIIRFSKPDVVVTIGGAIPWNSIITNGWFVDSYAPVSEYIWIRKGVEE
jgi:hypothetical protein